MKITLRLPMQTSDFGPAIYQVMCALSAAAIFVLRFPRAHYLVNFLGLIFGLGAVATGVRIGPILYLAVSAVSILADNWSMWGMDWGEPGHGSDILLSLFMLAYVAGHYRLQGLQHSIVPVDPRRRKAGKKGRPVVERPARSAKLVTVNEVGLLLLSLPIWALAAQFLSLWLGHDWQIGGINSDLSRLLLVLWLLGAGLLLAATVFAHWRRRQYDALAARLLLQDMLWKETRGEQRRINRWYALGKILGRDKRAER